MAPDEDLKKRVGRKLTKKRKPLRHSSIQYPERLMDEGDAHEDVTAAKGLPAQYMNQSVFSMITAAGSKVDFNARFEDESSEEDEEEEEEKEEDRAAKAHHRVVEHTSDISPLEHIEQQREEPVAQVKPAKEHGKFLEHSVLRSLPKLTSRTKKEKNYMSQSTTLPQHEDKSVLQRSITPRDAPVMSRMLEAEAQMGSSTTIPNEEREKVDTSSHAEGATSTPSRGSLATRLKEIFEFENPEEVISGVSLGSSS